MENKRKYVIKKILNSKILNYFGISIINLDFLLYVSHYKWIFKIFKIPYFKINFLQSDINQIDKKIISRIKKSYSISMSSKQGQNISGLWDYDLNQPVENSCVFYCTNSYRILVLFYGPNYRLKPFPPKEDRGGIYYHPYLDGELP